MLLWHIFWVFVLSYILGQAAGFVVQSLRRVARHFRTNNFLMAFLVLAVATSTPEIAVALSSAWRNVPELSLGNLLGASIVVLSLMTGLAVLLAGRLNIIKFFKSRDFLIYLVVVTLPALALIDGHLTRLDGLMLIAAYIYFLLHFHARRKAYPKQLKRPLKEKAHFKQEALILALAVAVLLVTSYFLVNSAIFVASALKISLLLVGLLLLSIGTNLPELALVITQSYRKTRDIAVGDLLGNVMLNVPILGLLALLRPFTLSQPMTALASILFLLVAVALFGVFIWSKNVLTRREGMALLAVYVLYAANNLGVLF